MDERQRIVIENVPAPMGTNSVLASLTSVLRARGEDVTYEHLMGVSGQAFRLQFNWCPSAPHAHCGFETFTPALRATGYEATRHPLAVWEAETRKQRTATEEELAVAREAVKGSLIGGVPVLIDSEESAVVVGCEPVSEANPTGWLRRPGPLPPPAKDAPYVSAVKRMPWELRTIRKSASTAPSRRESVLWSLRTAMQNARTEAYGGYSMGFAAWERWIRELGDIRPIIGKTQEILDKYDTKEEAPFGVQLGNAWCYDGLIDGRRCAAGYLRSVAGGFGKDASAHLLAAAEEYDNVVKALTEGAACSTLIAPYPWMEKEKWDNARRADQASRMVRALAHERTAITEVEKALKAEGVEVAISTERERERTVSKFIVKREGGKVWIDGAKGFSPAEYVDSVHGVQARIAETVGEAVTYDDLVCYSGFAFRVGAHKGMCPSAGHPCCGYECLETGLPAVPWKTDLYEGSRWAKPGPGPERDAFVADACAAIKDSIDRGVPVHYSKEEDGIIVGYADEGRRWWCYHPYHKGGKEAFWYDEAKGFAGGGWPWAVSVWSEPKAASERAGERDLTVAALTQAVVMWKTERNGDYFCGEAAYAHWLRWLRGVDDGAVKDPKAGMQGNGWYYNVLENSRGIAGRWLRKRAEGFTGEAREHLLRAADSYSRIHDVCMKDIGCSWNLAPGPNKLAEWTPEFRRKQIERLEAAREQDRAAIAEIEKALRSM